MRNSVVFDYPFELADDKKLQKRKKKFNRRKTKTVSDSQNLKNKLKKALKNNGVEMKKRSQKHENEKSRKKSRTKGKQGLTFGSIKRKTTLGDIMKHYTSKHKDRPVDIRNFFRMHV